MATFALAPSLKALNAVGVLPQATMNPPRDSARSMRGLNARLRGFLEQVGRLQEDNRKLEAQIVHWGGSRPHDWSRQEQAVAQLRTQVRPGSALSRFRSERVRVSPQECSASISFTRMLAGVRVCVCSV